MVKIEIEGTFPDEQKVVNELVRSCKKHNCELTLECIATSNNFGDPSRKALDGSWNPPKVPNGLFDRFKRKIIGSPSIAVDDPKGEIKRMLEDIRRK